GNFCCHPGGGKMHRSPGQPTRKADSGEFRLSTERSAMLKNLSRLLTTATLAAVLALPNIAFCQARAPEDKDDKPKTAKAGKKEGNEKHPVIHHSIQELQAVKKELTTKDRKSTRLNSSHQII